jgi:hypothetical protein
MSIRAVLSFIKSIFIKEPIMATTPVEPIVETPATTSVDTDKLKALLVALGHSVEAEWDHLVALAKAEA